MRTSILVLILMAALIGAGLMWLGCPRSDVSPVTDVVRARSLREREPRPEPAELARPDPLPARGPMTAQEVPSVVAAVKPPPLLKPGFDLRPWEDYQAMNLEELWRALLQLQTQLGQITQPILVERYRAGHGVRIARGPSTPRDDVTISAEFIAPAGDSWRVELPREERPDLYEVKDLTVRLQKLCEDRRSAQEKPR